ncbi:MAG: RNA 2',3'-cyclic phosphodiesterase [Alphaproteobacteria bacterium]|nr:RNA 2',3'-cyclic phosphodiesterase [Alphaproteobacteria bacterium]
MPRLFVALPIPEDVADRLSALQGGVPDANWVPSENFHITLAFLGEVDGGMTEDIHEALVTIDGPILDIALSGVDHFVDGQQPRALYAGVVQEDRLTRLREKVVRVLRGEGARIERGKFRPHVTLAHFNRRAEIGHHLAQFVASHSLFRAGPFEVDRFALYSSTLRPDGSVYEIEAEYPLGY